MEKLRKCIFGRENEVGMAFQQRAICCATMEDDDDEFVSGIARSCAHGRSFPCVAIVAAVDIEHVLVAVLVR